MHCLKIHFVTCFEWQWDVHIVTYSTLFSNFIRKTCSRKTMGVFMQAYVQNVVGVIKFLLSTISMVSVNIKYKNFFQFEFSTQILSSYSNIIEDTETTCLKLSCM